MLNKSKLITFVGLFLASTHMLSASTPVNWQDFTDDQIVTMIANIQGSLALTSQNDRKKNVNYQKNARNLKELVEAVDAYTPPVIKSQKPIVRENFSSTSVPIVIPTSSGIRKIVFISTPEELEHYQKLAQEELKQSFQRKNASMSSDQQHPTKGPRTADEICITEDENPVNHQVVTISQEELDAHAQRNARKNRLLKRLADATKGEYPQPLPALNVSVKHII